MKFTDISNNENIKTYKFLIEPEDYTRAKNTAYLKNRFRLISPEDQRPSYEFFELNLSDVLDRESIVQLSEKILEEAGELAGDALIINPTIIDMEHTPEDELYAVVEWVEDVDITTPEIAPLLEKVEADFGEPSEEEVEAILANMQKENARLIPVEEPINEDHMVSFDLSIFADDQEINRENNLLVTVNEDNPEYNRVLFDSKGNSRLVGHEVGDTFTISLAQPSSPDAYCEVTINQIYNPELPELDDDFASEISEYDTIDELRENLTAELQKDIEDSYWKDKVNEIYQSILDEAVIDIGDDHYHYQNPEESVNLLAQGTAVLDEAFIPVGIGNDYKNIRYQAEIPFLVAEALANDLEIEVTDEEIDSYLEELSNEKALEDFIVLNFINDSEHLSQLYNKDQRDIAEYILLLNKLYSYINDQIR